MEQMPMSACSLREPNDFGSVGCASAAVSVCDGVSASMRFVYHTSPPPLAGKAGRGPVRESCSRGETGPHPLRYARDLPRKRGRRRSSPQLLVRRLRGTRLCRRCAAGEFGAGVMR